MLGDLFWSLLPFLKEGIVCGSDRVRESARIPIAVYENDGLKAASAVFFYGTKLVTYFTNAGKFAKMVLLTAKRKNYSQIDYMSNIQPILDKAIAGERITAEDATILLESNDFVRLGLAAHEIRMRKNPTDVVTGSSAPKATVATRP